jgi:hypothetical protein
MGATTAAPTPTEPQKPAGNPWWKNLFNSEILGDDKDDKL